MKEFTMLIFIMNLINSYWIYQIFLHLRDLLDLLIKSELDKEKNL